MFVGRKLIRTIAALVVLLSTTGCTVEHYHINELQHARTASNQLEHVVALQKIVSRKQSGARWPSPDGKCPSFGVGYGAFTVSCPTAPR